MTNIWYLYYTVSPCGSGHNSALSYVKNTDALKIYGTIMVPCGIDYNAYVIEFFINDMIQYYGLLDTDTIYVNDTLYTKRWVCSSSTGICSQISSGSGYASQQGCTNVFPCNPNQWKINTPTLTGTVSVSGIYLAWSLTPKGRVAVNFNFGNSINYDGVGMTPVIYTDSAGITQIGVYKSGSLAGSSYAMNTSYHSGNADFYLLDSDVNVLSKTPGYVWEIQYPKGYIPPVCVPSYIGMCRQPLNGYEYDVNNCPGSIDRLNTKCSSGGTGGNGGISCNDPLKLGCVGSIPLTYVVVGAFIFMTMIKK